MPRLQARTRRHRVEAAWLALPLRPVAALDQEQEPKAPGSEARGRGGLGSGTLAMSVGFCAGRPVGNIHRAQGVCSDGSPPQHPAEGSPETPPDLPLDCDTRAGFSSARRARQKASGAAMAAIGQKGLPVMFGTFDSTLALLYAGFISANAKGGKR